MFCWYYEKKDLVNTPSFRDGISPETEARYRKDGARLILDAGAKMGLRYETCSTGVVYFHRFYMFHSFAEFPKCLTAAGCLFLAGKVEETPKKCRDLIRIIKTMLPEQQFTAFKDDPKEEIMMMEKILLQTIKFDLNVEHPYAYLLKFAKLIKGDKEKVQKLVQMSWTFVNDSLCTSLCLQWEADVIAVALIYLASRLSKFDISDWHGKGPGCRNRWYECFVEGVTLELLEDICHQVLDLYSRPTSKTSSPAQKKGTPSLADKSVQLQNLGSNQQQGHFNSSNVQKNNSSIQGQNVLSVHPSTTSSLITLTNHSQNQLLSNNNSLSMQVPPQPPMQARSQPVLQEWSGQQYHTNNPYIATTMFSSSFLSKEGTRSIRSLFCKQDPSGPSPVANSYSSQTAPPPPPPPSASQNYQSYPLSDPIQPVFPNKTPLLAHPPHFNSSWR